MKLLITPPQVQTRVARREKVAFVDCRTRDAWDRAEAKLCGARHVERPDPGEAAAGLSRHATVVVYGERGWEEGTFRLAHGLRALGFGDVRILAGGFAAWTALGLPVEPAHLGEAPAKA